MEMNIERKENPTALERMEELLAAVSEAIWNIADREAKEMGFRDPDRFDAMWEKYKDEVPSWRWETPAEGVTHHLLTSRMIPASVSPLVDFCAQEGVDPLDIELKGLTREVALYSAYLLREEVIRKMGERRKKVKDPVTETTAFSIFDN